MLRFSQFIRESKLPDGYRLEKAGDDKFHLHHGDNHVATISSYHGYIDKKNPKSRLVSSRKEATLWNLEMKKGHYDNPFHDRPSYGLKSKGHALDSAINAHNPKAYDELRDARYKAKVERKNLK